MIFSSTLGLKETRALLLGLGGADRKSESNSASSAFRIVPDSVARRRSGLPGFGAARGAAGRAIGTRDTIGVATISQWFKERRLLSWRVMRADFATTCVLGGVAVGE